MNHALLRAEIERQGFVHKTLAGRIGMHPSRFSRALAGKVIFDPTKLATLLKILGLKFETVVVDEAS